MGLIRLRYVLILIFSIASMSFVAHCQTPSELYQEAEAAFNNGEWQKAHNFYQKFILTRPRPSPRFQKYVNNRIRYLQVEKGAVDEMAIERERQRQASLVVKVNPRVRDFKVTKGQLQSAEDIISNLKTLASKGKAIVQKFKADASLKTSLMAEADTHLLPEYDALADSIFRFIAVKPESNEHYVNAVINTDVLRDEWRRSFANLSPLDFQLYSPYSNKFVNIFESRLRKYRNMFTGFGLDLDKIVDEIMAGAWNIYDPSRVLQKYFPENDGRAEVYPEKVKLAFQSINGKMDYYWALLPKDSAPKLQAEKVASDINRVSGLWHSLAVVKAHNAYVGWGTDYMPLPVREAIDASEARRRSDAKKLRRSINQVSSDQRNPNVYGFVISVSTKAEVMDNYTSMLERFFAEKAFSFPPIGVNSTGLLDRPFFLRRADMPVNGHDLEISCLEYKAIRKGNTQAIDCFFFEKNVLVGFNLNLSQENCAENCVGYKPYIMHLRKYGFDFLDESSLIEEGVTKQVWATFDSDKFKMNVTLWGALYSIKTEKSRFFERESSGFRQFAQLCVFPKKLEALLKDVSTTTPSYTCT